MLHLKDQLNLDRTLLVNIHGDKALGGFLHIIKGKGKRKSERSAIALSTESLLALRNEITRVLGDGCAFCKGGGCAFCQPAQAAK